MPLLPLPTQGNGSWYPHYAQLDAQGRGVYRFTGGDPTGAGDSTADLQSAIAAAGAAGQVLLLPRGIFKTTAPLTASTSTTFIAGAGPLLSVISATHGGDALVVGPSVLNLSPSGKISNLGIKGKGRTLTPGAAGLKLKTVTQMLVESVQVDDYDIGFDLVGNCFGAMFTNLRGGFGGTLNVGVNLRVGNESGSDITFVNPWINGRKAGFHVSGDGGGYHVYAGQVTGGQGLATVDTEAGALVLGKDYLTGATGETSMDLHGTSFEGTSFAHCMRSYAQVRLNLDAVAFSPQNSASPAITALSMTSAQNSSVRISGSPIGGYWSAAKPISVAGTYDEFFLLEQGSYCPSNQPTFNGVKGYVRSLVKQSLPLPGRWQVTGPDGITTQAGVLGAGGGAAPPVDPVAGTAGSRTLGTGAQQAAAGNDARFTTLPITAVGGAAYTLLAADAGKVVEVNTAAAATVSVPASGIPIGSVIEVFQAGAGQVTINAGAGATLRAAGGAKTQAQYLSATLRQRALGEWVVAGAVVA